MSGKAASIIRNIKVQRKTARQLFMDNLNSFIRTFYHKSMAQRGIFDFDYMKYGINFMEGQIDNARPEDIQAAIDLSYDFVKRLEENGYKHSSKD